MTIEQQRKAIRYALTYLNKELLELKSHVARIERAETQMRVIYPIAHLNRRIEEMERDIAEFEQLTEEWSL